MPAPDWYPSVDDVGALLRARTRTTAGAEAGTFTDATNPTADQVEAIIAGAQAEVVGIFGGDNVLPRYNTAAKRLVALKAAIDIELSYYPEQTATGRSPYSSLNEQFKDTLARVEMNEVLVTTTDQSDPLDPVFAFGPRPWYDSSTDPSGTGVIGMRTRW